MRDDHPLANRKSLSFRKDLVKEPLIMSRLTRGQPAPGIDVADINIVATYNLAYNASLMVEDGLGVAVCFDSIVNVNGKRSNNLVFIPIDDMRIDVHPALIWKKYQTISRTSKAFVEELKSVVKLL